MKKVFFIFVLLTVVLGCAPIGEQQPPGISLRESARQQAPQQKAVSEQQQAQQPAQEKSAAPVGPDLVISEIQVGGTLFGGLNAPKFPMVFKIQNANKIAPQAAVSVFYTVTDVATAKDIATGTVQAVGANAISDFTSSVGEIESPPIEISIKGIQGIDGEVKFKITAKIDPQDEIPETNENNNQKEVLTPHMGLPNPRAP